MLIDAFTYCGETDMLEFRLKMLSPMVDRFVIVEADHTFSGEKKPFYLDEQYEKFRNFHDDIIYERVIVPEKLLNYSLPKPNKYDPLHPCWRIEYFQRNAIADACQIYNDSSVVMIGDVDEIPRNEAIQYALERESTFPIVFRQHVFAYNLRFMRNIMWNGTIITSLGDMRGTSPQRLRDKRNSLLAIDHGGWHLSYFTDADSIRHKIESFSHQEFNKDEYKSDDHIAYCMESGEDLFERDCPAITAKKDQFPDYFNEYAPQKWWAV